MRRALTKHVADVLAVKPLLAQVDRLRRAGEFTAAADAYDVIGDAFEERGNGPGAAAARRQAWGLRMHGRNWQTVKMVFRVYRPDPGVTSVGEVIALMPELTENDPRFVMSYMHVGQHGAASYAGVIRSTRPAQPAEYARLFDELTRIGYDVVPIERFRRPR